MAGRDPRKMALQIAGMRAGETQLPENERVFEDPYAAYFFPPDIREHFKDVAAVRAERAQYEQMMPGVNGALAARIRYIDECLRDEIENGLRQLVVIGAGYDTRAYRIEGVREALMVFEVDHPDTQAVKKETIRSIFNGLPGHVAYVPVVFGQDRLDEKLLQHGYKPQLKTLFIVEGLLMYIPPAAVDALLAFVTGASAPGSALVGDVFDTTVVDGTSDLPEARVLRQFVETEGSQLQFGIPAGTVESFFMERGFTQVACVSTEACKKKYFGPGSRDRTVSSMFSFVNAATGI